MTSYFMQDLGGQQVAASISEVSGDSEVCTSDTLKVYAPSLKPSASLPTLGRQSSAISRQLGVKSLLPLQRTLVAPVMIQVRHDHSADAVRRLAGIGQNAQRL